jgi:hypothetical protein
MPLAEFPIIEIKGLVVVVARLFRFKWYKPSFELSPLTLNKVSVRIVLLNFNKLGGALKFGPPYSEIILILYPSVVAELIFIYYSIISSYINTIVAVSTLLSYSPVYN